MEIETDSLLACGHSLDSVWDTLGTDPTPHQKNCTYCQEARKQLTAVDKATRELRESDESDPQMKLGPAFTATIMDIARAEVRRGRKIPLTDGEVGEVNISEQALTALIRSALEEMPEIHARRCRIDVRMNDSAGADSSEPMEPTELVPQQDVGETMHVNLRVATLASVAIHETVEHARQLVSKRLLDVLGTTVDTINITVEDIFDD